MRTDVLEMFKVRCDVYGMELDEAMGALAMSEILQHTYVQRMIPCPEWLLEQVRNLQYHIKRKYRDQLARKLRSAEVRLVATKQTKDPEGFLTSEVEELRKQLQELSAS